MILRYHESISHQISMLLKLFKETKAAPFGVFLLAVSLTCRASEATVFTRLEAMAPSPQRSKGCETSPSGSHRAEEMKT